MEMILASFSRARAELLRAAGYSFTQHPSGVHERPFESGEDPGAYVEELAAQKTAAVAQKFPEAVVLGADTVLHVEGRVFGKPADLDDAVRMLTYLCGRTHDLVTGICVASAGGRTSYCAHDIARITMRPHSPEAIRRHVELAQPLPFAGAYALQQEGCVLIERMEGDPNTVIGLPLGLVAELVERALTAGSGTRPAAS